MKVSRGFFPKGGLGLLLWACWGPLFANSPVADGLFTVDSQVDWQQNRITLELSIPVEQLDDHSRGAAEDIFAVNTVHWLRQGLEPLVINSQQTIATQWQQISQWSEANLSSRLQKMLQSEGSFFSTDFRAFRARYSLRIYPDLVELWTHESIFIPELPARIEISDHPPYTGLLIYAGGARPIQGEASGTAQLQPALFPRIFDQDMNLLLDSRYVDPVYLKQWGVVGYHQGDEPPTESSRVGQFPLRTRALAYWGNNRSDILLPRSAAARINSSSMGRKALQQGRILVLLGSS